MPNANINFCRDHRNCYDHSINFSFEQLYWFYCYFSASWVLFIRYEINSALFKTPWRKTGFIRRWLIDETYPGSSRHNFFVPVWNSEIFERHLTDFLWNGWLHGILKSQSISMMPQPSRFVILDIFLSYDPQRHPGLLSCSNNDQVIWIRNLSINFSCIFTDILKFL